MHEQVQEQFRVLIGLVTAKLDRLSRNLALIATLMDSRVEFVAVDNPHANKLTVHILAAVAQHEREMISANYDEPELLRSSSRHFSLTGADVGHSCCYSWRPSKGLLRASQMRRLLAPRLHRRRRGAPAARLAGLPSFSNLFSWLNEPSASGIKSAINLYRSRYIET